MRDQEKQRSCNHTKCEEIARTREIGEPKDYTLLHLHCLICGLFFSRKE